ncbi:MAG: 50S ribosomal protein L13 [Candidatus Pelagibacterales bacterium]|jgi:large subunit ribosomal protein L13|tara:strand:+ start:506 stop:970 length:465 start_codon:yes stop_codon:yes gene_type:complete
MTTSKFIKQTKSANASNVNKKWLLVDAEDVVLGRLATTVSNLLRGKHKSNYTPHVDCGDNVIIINAEKIKLTGNKLNDKTYYWHTGYPGGIKSRTAKKILEGKFPDRIIRLAVKRMIPKGPLGSQQISNMKVYNGSAHPHDAQAPEKLDISELI